MPKRRIVVSEYDNIACIFEDDKAVEFLIHRGDILLGDIFLAQVENVLPSIDAGFVNVGGDKMGFLHSSDVPGKGDLKTRLQPKQTLVVQVMKEPTGHKGPRVTTNISLPGRFLVMMPESKGISISRKIMDAKERSRLKSVVSLIKPPGVGVIIRTEAMDQKESDIQEDFETLLERWQNIVTLADSASPPTLLYRDQDLLYRVIREAVNEDVQEMMVDSNFGLQRAQQLLQNWNMDKNIKVTQYTGNQPIMIGTGIDREIKLALQTKVPMPSGGYLYIQQTEALSVVDVNSGKFTSLDSQAETIKLTNLEACKEIARQLRLRNIGGMIIVDFIDMESRADQLKIMQAFENELAPDKSKPQIGQLSDLGLVEMTRHRQGQALSEIFSKKCTACNGTGHSLEEFSWSPGDGRGSVRFNPRQKFPMKQSRQQQVPRAQAQAQRHQKPTLPTLIDPNKEKQQQTATEPGSILLSKPKNTGDTKLKAAVEKNILDYFNDRILNELGVRFPHYQVAKVAITPPEVNVILCRINPKANDILSLVQSIEASPLQAASMTDRMGMDDDDESEDGDDDAGENAGDLTNGDLNNGHPELLPRISPEDNGDAAEFREGSSVATLEEREEHVSFNVLEPSSENGSSPVLDQEEVMEVIADDDDEDEMDTLEDEDETSDTEGADAAPKRRGRPPKRSIKRPARPKKPAE